MAADGSVVIEVVVDQDGVYKGVKSVKNQFGGLEKSVKRLGGLIAGAFGIAAIVKFAKSAIDLGSDVQEVQNVVDTAFGDMAYKAEEFASTAITQFGMSSLAAKKTASNYMAMARGMGVVPEAASDMSIALAGLSGDVASFYNLNQEEAAQKLAGVFTGEGEALKSIGVVMTETNLEAYALSKGITKQTKDMTQAEKVALRYGFVMDNLSLAQGDFAKTSDGWANQTRILSMQFQEFMSIVGQALITVLRPLVVVLNQIVGWLIAAANAFNTAVQAIFGDPANEIKQTQQGAEEVSGAIAGAVGEQDALTDATKETAKAQKAAVAGFDEINKLSSGSGSGGEAEGASGGGGVNVPGLVGLDINTTKAEKEMSPFGGFVENFCNMIAIAFSDTISSVREFFGTLKGIWADIKTLGDPLKEWFRGNELKGLVSNALSIADTYYSSVLDIFNTVIGDLWSNFAFPIIDFGLKEGLPRITELFSEVVKTAETAFAGLKAIFDTIWDSVFAPGLKLLSTMWIGLWGSILNFWDTYGAPIFEAVREAIGNFVDVFVNYWNKFLAPVVNKIFEVATDLWNNHLKPLFDKLGTFIGELVLLIMNLWNNVLAPVVNWLIDVLGPVFSNIWSGIVEMFGWVFGVISDVCGWILDVFNGLLSFLNDIFAADWGAIWDGIKDAAGAAWDWIKGIWEGVANWFNDTIVKPIANFFGGLWEGIKNAAGALAGWIEEKVIDPIVDAFKWLYNSVVGIIEGVINGFIGIINGFISGINGVISIINKIPGVELPKIGELGTVEIPRLAQGAVIPPNREFMAVLGDQKSGTNIETPLSTMIEAFTAAMQNMGMGGGQTVVMQIDGREFGRFVNKYGVRESNRIGVNLAGVK